MCDWFIASCCDWFQDENCVTRCENVVKTIKNSIKKKKLRRKGPIVRRTTVASSSSNQTNAITPTTSLLTTTTTSPLRPHQTANSNAANKKLRSKPGDMTQFLRQFLKKSFSMTDLQMKPYRTDEYIHKLFYETARFSAFNHQWIVKAIINNSQRDVHQCNDRHITYQVQIIIIYHLKLHE